MTYEVIATLDADNRVDETPTSDGCNGRCACGETEPAGLPELDARAIPHAALRHAAIFGAFDGFAAGHLRRRVPPVRSRGMAPQPDPKGRLT
jgi:hypothetical protein